jgi:hypothetical protein
VQRLGDPVLRPFLQVDFLSLLLQVLKSKQLLGSHFSHVNDYHNWITDDAQTVHVNRMLSNLDHKYSCWLPLCWRNHFSYRRYCNRLDFRCWEMWELGCALNLVSFKTHFTFFWSFFITCKETNGIFLPVLMFSTMFLGGHFSTAWLGTPLYSTGNIHHTLVSCRSISFVRHKIYHITFQHMCSVFLLLF